MSILRIFLTCSDPNPSISESEWLRKGELILLTILLLFIGVQPEYIRLESDSETGAIKEVARPLEGPRRASYSRIVLPERGQKASVN
jgi:hypothetical protein